MWSSVNKEIYAVLCVAAAPSCPLEQTAPPDYVFSPGERLLSPPGRCHLHHLSKDAYLIDSYGVCHARLGSLAQESPH
eukprot:1581235-Amphidinium_carterae.1